MTWPDDWLATSAGAPCPSCGSSTGRPILFGMPSREVFEAMDAGVIDIGLGGCCTADDDPTHHCSACGTEFRLTSTETR